MSLIASVSSSKGGSGKSTTSMNLGVCLSKLGRDVTVIDANLSTPYLSMYLGAPHVPVTLHDVLQGTATIHEAVYQHRSGVKIIPGSLSMKNVEKCNLDDLQHHLPRLKSEVILLDGAPGLDREARSAIKLADETLVITTPELPSVAQSLKTIRVAKDYDKIITGVVLTRAGHDLDLKIHNIQTILEQPIVGVVPEDPYVKKAMFKREPVSYVYPHAPSSQAYAKLALYLTGKATSHEDVGHFYQFLNWAFGKR